MTPLPDPASIAAALGIDGVVESSSVGGGRSGAWLWRLHRVAPGPDLLLRVFPHTSLADVEREVALQRHAVSGGIPAPAVDFVGLVDGRPVMVMDWVPTPTMAETLSSDPSRADDLGRSSGRTLAAIHRLPPPADLTPGGTLSSWLAATDDWLVRLVSAPYRPAVPIHADFHPSNLLTDGSGIVAVLDWTNAAVGHPSIDLGRTFACLRFGVTKLPVPNASDVVDRWWRALVEGYGGTDLTVEDLAPSSPSDSPRLSAISPGRPAKVSPPRRWPTCAGSAITGWTSLTIGPVEPVDGTLRPSRHRAIWV